MIKLQTGATRREGGKEEGREEERFLERRGKQDMEKEKKKGKHRGGLFQAEVLSLQGLCIFQGQTDRNKTLAVHFLTYKTLERSRHYSAVTDINMEQLATQLAAPCTCGTINRYTSGFSEQAGWTMTKPLTGT